jgi:hypothetical protein
VASNDKTQRYRVKGPVFVNDVLIEPKGDKTMTVMARPGLEGKALEAVASAPAKTTSSSKPAKAKASEKDSDNGAASA